MRNSQQSDFFAKVPNEETTKTINNNFLQVLENLKNIVNTSDCIGIATALWNNSS